MHVQEPFGMLVLLLFVAAGAVDVTEAGDCYLCLRKKFPRPFPFLPTQKGCFWGRVGGGFPMENHNKREK